MPAGRGGACLLTWSGISLPFYVLFCLVFSFFFFCAAVLCAGSVQISAADDKLHTCDVHLVSLDGRPSGCNGFVWFSALFINVSPMLLPFFVLS